MSTAQAGGIISIDLPSRVLAAIAGTPEDFAQEMRLAAAVEWYREGRISQGQGAEIAGIGRAEFLEALARAKVSACQVSEDELMEEVDRAAEAYRGRIPADPAGEGGTT